MIILDSNVWIGFLSVNDSNHEQAVRVWSGLVWPILLPEYVLLEVATVLSLRVDKKTADAWLAYVFDNKDVELLPSNGEFLLEVAAWYLRKPHRGLSFVDVALLYLGKHHTVITFDAQLRKALEN